MSRYYGHGKLLLTAEYAVLDGAKALAIPTQKGQSLEIQEYDREELFWKSYDHKGQLWFKDQLLWKDEAFRSQSQTATGKRLEQLLNAIITLKPGFHDKALGQQAITHLEFPANWGLGSSSTLVVNLASWAQVNPYELLEASFGGSGYDLACAKAESPILYTRNRFEPQVESVSLNWNFTDRLWFVHLNEKKNSREAISHYRSQSVSQKEQLILEVNDLTQQFLEAKTLEQLETAIDRHEVLLSRVLGLPPIKEKRFKDFRGSIKSLGGWGGDFVLATDPGDAEAYFRDKGYPTICAFSDMIL
ncbi:GYDIA family GHMP kinase [Croceiramulus getboli]|nr:GYDIA family GHMP kinase [Flavobacteriaceae bacterium YJPT1-3]